MAKIQLKQNYMHKYNRKWKESVFKNRICQFCITIPIKYSSLNIPFKVYVAIIKHSHKIRNRIPSTVQDIFIHDNPIISSRYFKCHYYNPLNFFAFSFL